MEFRRVRRALAVLGLACISAAGCRGAATDQPEAEPFVVELGPGETYLAETAGLPEDGDWLVLRYSSDPATLNPVLGVAESLGASVAGHVLESLLELDYQSGALKPLLAESYEVSSDYLSYTFHLRPDARFSDGNPVTAEDVKFSFEAVLDPANDTEPWRNRLRAIESIEVLNGRSIRLRCARPYFKHLHFMGLMPIFPRHIYGGGPLDEHPANRAPVGSGPYVFVSWKSNQELVLKRNAGYWLSERRPHLDQFVYRIISNDNTAFQALEQGHLDYMGLSTEQWTHRAVAPSFGRKFNRYRYHASGGAYGVYGCIEWNNRHPPFDDARVRRAMTLLLDRELILDTIFAGLGIQLSGPFIPGMPEYNPAVAPQPFDPDQARALLAEAGWRGLNGGGILHKDGQPFAFELLAISGYPELEQIATVYQEELRRAGIDMRIRMLEWASLVDQIMRRHFDATFMNWGIESSPDPYHMWHSTQADRGFNDVGFANSEVDALLEAAREEFDPDARARLYHRLHAILDREQPFTFLYSLPALTALDRRFNGVNVYPLGMQTREWWAPAEGQRYR